MTMTMTMMMVDHDEVKQILYLYSSNTFFFLELENMSNKLFSPRCTRARRDEIFVVGGGHVGVAHSQVKTTQIPTSIVSHESVGLCYQ